jgi:hypothetical protein
MDRPQRLLLVSVGTTFRTDTNQPNLSHPSSLVRPTHPRRPDPLIPTPWPANCPSSPRSNPSPWHQPWLWIVPTQIPFPRAFQGDGGGDSRGRWPAAATRGLWWWPRRDQAARVLCIPSPLRAPACALPVHREVDWRWGGAWDVAIGHRREESVQEQEQERSRRCSACAHRWASPPLALFCFRGIHGCVRFSIFCWIFLQIRVVVAQWSLGHELEHQCEIRVSSVPLCTP